eukprot:jgi/Bigna1/70203/fgenesh1_pg.11_\
MTKAHRRVSAWPLSDFISRSRPPLSPSSPVFLLLGLLLAAAASLPSGQAVTVTSIADSRKLQQPRLSPSKSEDPRKINSVARHHELRGLVLSPSAPLLKVSPVSLKRTSGSSQLDHELAEAIRAQQEKTAARSTITTEETGRTNISEKATSRTFADLEQDLASIRRLEAKDLNNLNFQLLQGQQQQQRQRHEEGYGDQQLVLPIPLLPVMYPPGYLGASDVVDQPGSNLTKKVPTIDMPFASTCHVRPATIEALGELDRVQAKLLGKLDRESFFTNKRKQYVREMTELINSKIKQLNQVKNELDQELQWINVTKEHVQEISEKKKLMQLTDKQKCVQQSGGKEEGGEKKKEKEEVEKTLTSQIDEVKKNIKDIKARIQKIKKGGDSSAGESKKS